MMQDAPGNAALLQAAACRVPASKDELAYYLRYLLRIVCERCGGSGAEPGARRACLRCDGAGWYGLTLPDRAVCPGHVAPLDVAWMLWTGQPANLFLVAGRGCGKTRLLAAIAHMKMRLLRQRVGYMGAQGQQSDRAARYVEDQLSDRVGLPVGFDPQTLDPIPMVAGALPELGKPPRGLPGGGKEILLSHGAHAQFLPGTLEQASGPHPDLSILDEADLADPELVEQWGKTPREAFVLATTRYRPGGTWLWVARNLPHVRLVEFCLWEVLQRCVYDCDRAPLGEGLVGRCPLYEEERLVGGVRERVPLCGGQLARRACGWLPVAEAIQTRLRSTEYGFAVQQLCRRPTGRAGDMAYWGYGPWTLLPADPPVDPARPLHLAVDFNRSERAPMSWVVIQEQSDATGWPAFAVVDEVVLPGATTGDACEEVAARYGPGGRMLPQPDRARGLVGGLWVVGDATGHSQRTVTTDTDYTLIQRRFEGWPDFRLLTPSGETNPPLAERLETLNLLLWDPIARRATLRVAPRCVEVRRELEHVVLRPGSRMKDKHAAEEMGLSHLGDCMEYWAWRWFPRGRIDRLRAGTLAEVVSMRTGRAAELPQSSRPGGWFDEVQEAPGGAGYDPGQRRMASGW